MGSPAFAEFPLPRRSDALAVIVGRLVVLAASSLAVWNLARLWRTPVVSLIASVVWLLMVLFILVETIREDGGMRQYLVNRLAPFSSRHALRAVPAEHAKSIAIGFHWGERFLSSVIVDVDAIVCIRWDPGQATALSGRDMSDWHVALWRRRPQRGPGPGIPDADGDEVSIIGPTGSRVFIAGFGLRLVEFLQAAGVPLQAGPGDCQYRPPQAGG